MKQMIETECDALERYSSYEQVKKAERINKDYRIRIKEGETDKIVVAIHGGNIEPGTSEIAEAIAGGKHSFYAFEGIKPHGNRILHIKSTKFDEPYGVRMVGSSRSVLSIHGCGDETCIVFIGGRDRGLKKTMLRKLTKAGFAASEKANGYLTGMAAENICNRGINSEGVQLELSAGLRKKMMRSLKAQDRTVRTGLFYYFLRTICGVFDGYPS